MLQIMDMEEEDEAIREKAQSLIETVIKGVKEQLEALQKKERGIQILHLLPRKPCPVTGTSARLTSRWSVFRS